ncbi:NHL repeat-containing protein [Vibrio campbellii]|uniref:hypothetical protein n=1 Tax=Vibrio campbellii TaxID=680 RepID=UPI001E2F9F1E|nr:hypothetical protein [Vibrio campbellii]MCC8252545.1 hypothetical protein [Vibrio campbellii CAIM 333]
MSIIRTIKGKVIYTDGSVRLISRGLDVYSQRNNNKKEKLVVSLPSTKIDRLFSKSRLLSRLLRLGVHHYLKTRDDEIFFFNKSIYSLKHNKVLQVFGSRPLCVCSDKSGNIYYGRYHSNVNRGITSEVFRIDANDLSVSVFCEFDDVRHIHGVFFDEFTNRIWVTTGDVGSECGIWVLDNQGNKAKFIGGGQQERAVALLFSESSIYYGTDSPLEQNYIYKIDRTTRERQELTPVSGSVFYAIKAQGCYYFSTVVEPSDVNKSKYVELWKYSERASKIFETKKDIYPLKLFQYGQLTFPLTVKDSLLHVFCSGVNSDGNTLIFDFVESEEIDN